MTTHMYYIEGLTDRAAQFKQAHRRAERFGEETVVHYHPLTHGAVCSGKCIVVAPKEQDNGNS